MRSFLPGNSSGGSAQRRAFSTLGKGLIKESAIALLGHVHRDYFMGKKKVGHLFSPKLEPAL